MTSRILMGMALALGLGLGLAWPAAADGPPGLDEGWRQGSQGHRRGGFETRPYWRGTGANFGRGYRRDAQGEWHGTGKDFGRGWRRDGSGNWRGTGKNFGQGWRRN